MSTVYTKVYAHENLLPAWSRVKENHGCAGVDGVTIERFEERLDQNLINLQKDLQRKTYQSLPLLKFLVDKGNGEARPL